MSGDTPIVVIEDDPQMMRFLKIGLDAHGYSVIDARTGKEGLAAIASAKPDVVLLDLALPDIDGIEIIDIVRGWLDAPIIVLSSRTSADDKIAALDRGANDYVTKPFDMGELLARIRAALRHRVRRTGTEPVFNSGNLHVDLVRREVRLAGKETACGTSWKTIRRGPGSSPPNPASAIGSRCCRWNRKRRPGIARPRDRKETRDPDGNLGRRRVAVPDH